MVARRDTAIELDDESVDRLFHALADRTRRQIVQTVLRDACSISALASAYPMSFAAIQKHVAVLQHAGLVEKRRNGREQLVSGNVEMVRHASHLLDCIETIWRERVDRIDGLLATMTSPNPKARR